MDRFAGRAALVTSVTRPPGMGRAVARRLAGEGASLWLVDPPAEDAGPDDSSRSDPVALKALAAELRRSGATVVDMVRPLSGEEAIDSVVDEVNAGAGRLDVACVMGGGTGQALGTGPLVDLGLASWEACMRANLLDPLLITRAAARAMTLSSTPADDGGSVVVLSSYAGRSATAGYGAFGAARGALERAIEVLAAEVGPLGVRVNAVLPLGVEPGETTANPGLAELTGRAGRDDLDAWVRRRIPLGRLQSPDEVAALVAFLASHEAGFVTGQAIASAGGALG